KIGPDPRNFNQRVSLGRNDLLIRTFPNAVMLLTASNSGAKDKSVKQGNTTFDYNVTGGIKSFDYAAALAKPNASTAFTAGAFSAAATYSIVYK
ncbi:hypothetical protein V5073_04895, partial [Citrobacter braakii]